MSPMEQLARQEYERGYSDGKSDYFAAGVAEGEMRARQRMIANRVVSNQHPFAASGKPIDHIANADKMIGCAYCDNPLFAGTKCNNCGRVTLAEPVKQEPVAWHDKIKGMEVSVDVSTGEDDAHHRVFGRVDSVMLESCGAQEDIILVIEESRNYAAPVDAKAIRAEAYQKGRDDMKEEAAKEAWNLAPTDESAGEIAAAIRGLK